MLKLSENPPLLSHQAALPSDLTGQWWIAHTKSRSEKALAWDLASAGVGYFLPMARKTTFSGGRKRQVMRPLFPSYVFVCGDAEARYRTMTTGRVCNVLAVPDQPKLITELTSVYRALTGGPELDLYPFAAVGRRCRVTAGPLMGIEGIVVQRTQRATLVLEISLLKQGAALEIGLDLVEPVEEG
jgi:transcriptional antiterminator RfaH